MTESDQTKNLSSKRDQTIKFTVDGRSLEVRESKQVVADVLRLAGLDPNGYDLGEIRKGRPEPKVFGDNDTIKIKNGDEFVSIREDATVA